MSTASRSKGVRGENELCKTLQSMGYRARRTASLQAGNYGMGDPDVEIVELPLLHVECKRVERINIEKSMKQSENDALKRMALPVVMHRTNGADWLVTVRLEKLHRLCEMVMDARYAQG